MWKYRLFDILHKIEPDTNNINTQRIQDIELMLV